MNPTTSTPAPAPAPTIPTRANVVSPGSAPISGGKAAPLRREEEELLDDVIESAEERGADRPVEGAGSGGAEHPSCRQVHSDGSEEDCGHTAVLPWSLAGGAMLLAGAGAVASSGESGKDRASAASPPPPSPPAPAPAPAPAPPLAAPRLSTSSGKATIDGNGHVEVLLASPGTSWVYRLDGDSTWHAGSGDRLDTATLGRGVHAVMVAQLDDQGRPGEVATLAVRVHDEVTAPTLALAHDTGSSATDGVTNDGTVALSGLIAGGTWFYRVNGAAEWIQGEGTQVPAGALVEGRNLIEAYQLGNDGEHGALASLAVMLDLSPPAAPVLKTNHGAGLLNALDAVNVIGVERGATWEYRIDGGDWQVGRGDSLGAAALPEGDHTVDVRQTDSAGNVGEIGSLAVTVDLTPPDVLQMSVRTRDGVVAPNDLINATGFVAIDMVETGGTWEFKVDGDEDWHAGGGTQLSTRQLHEGENTVHLRQIDAAGNAGEETTGRVILDTVAPDMPILSSSTGKWLMNARGHIQIGGIEDGAQLTVKVDGKVVQLASDNPAFQGYRFGAGSHSVEAYVTDAAGNVSASAVATYTVDVQSPNAPSLYVSGGRIQRLSDHVDVIGLEANSTWWYRVDDQGAWIQGSGSEISGSAFVNATAASDLHAVSVYQVDAVGNQSFTRNYAFWSDIPPPAGV